MSKYKRNVSTCASLIQRKFIVQKQQENRKKNDQIQAHQFIRHDWIIPGHTILDEHTHTKKREKLELKTNNINSLFYFPHFYCNKNVLCAFILC